MKLPTNLLCVKSIITILITITFCILVFIYPDLYAENFKQIAVMIVSFYFAHQYDKINKNIDNSENKRGDKNE